MTRNTKFGLALILFVSFAGNSFCQKKKIELSEIWLEYKFMPAFPESFNWMKDDRFYSVLEEGKIQQYSIDARKKDAAADPVATILDIAALKDPDSGEELEIESYTFSDDEKKIMLLAESENIYRHSSRERIYVWDKSAEKLFKIHQGEKIMYCTFSPDASKVGYVFENNLWVFDFGASQPSQITSDGKTNMIINGGTDWVYEEEFAFDQAFFWSPDNRKIAYYRFDESRVKEFSMDKYGTLYPEPYKFKYPKAGEDNALVTVHIHDLLQRGTVDVDLGTETDQYIPRIKWTRSAEWLALIRMNRLQNKAEVMLANSESGKSRTIMTEERPTYISEISDNTWHFLENGKEFLWQSERDGWNHIYRFDMSGNLVNQVTKGEWEVTEIAAIDNTFGSLYYMSTASSPVDRHLYRVSFDGSGMKKLTKSPGWHGVNFSSKQNYFLDTWGTIDAAPSTALFSNEGKLELELENNAAFADKLKEYDIVSPEFFEFKTSENIILNGWMMKPSDFDKNRKYPVLMFVYGGPGSQTVKNDYGYFNYIWYQMLVQQGYIVVSVDNRGTGGRGEEFKKVTYANLGKYETIDQIEAAKWLGKLAYVDPARIGIWGWSYGGYMTSLCLTKGQGVFKMGIAVAPVTNWRYYDTIYTERYLRKPQDNAAGYDENSPIHFAKDLQGSYLLIHGMADDNVHFQNSVEWTDALVKANKQFEMFFYPNKNHGIYGGPTRFHLYRKMTGFILENL